MILYHFYPNRVEIIEVLNEYSFPGKLVKDDEWYWEEMEEEHGNND